MEVRQIEFVGPDLLTSRSGAGCQCDLGEDKLPEPPPPKHVLVPDWDYVRTKLLTAPIIRDDMYAFPTDHVLCIFQSPLHPDECFAKVFPLTTPIRDIKMKLASLLSVSNSNLWLAKNRTILRDPTLLRDLKTNAVGNIDIDVFTKNSEDFSLSNIPKETYIEELIKSYEPRKKTLNFILVRYTVCEQQVGFTRPYHALTKVHEIKQKLSMIFDVKPSDLLLFEKERLVEDHESLNNLDYDQEGFLDIELYTKSGRTLRMEKLSRLEDADILAITVPLESETKKLRVEVIRLPEKKPYLGGYRNTRSGIEYHHAQTQTPPRPEKLLPSQKTCRDTQTAEEREIVVDTPYSRSTQMQTNCCYIPNVTDRIIDPRPYETYSAMVRRLRHNHHASVIQRAFRHHQFRQKVDKWLKHCRWRIDRMKEEERLEREAIERRLRRDLITKTFPRTREDFDQLYAMVDHWMQGEIARISKLHSKGPKTAEFTLLLDKEVELLRTIEDYRVKVKEDSRKIKEQKFLEEISKPVSWFGRSGHIITMETIEIQKARQFRDLYKAFTKDEINEKERMELLVNTKMKLNEVSHPLAEEIIDLIDRECDLMVRRCNDHQLEFLRRRLAACIFRMIQTSELNHRVLKSQNIRDFRKMQNNRLYFCDMCKKVKLYTDFPINTRMNAIHVCKSCSWKDTHERLWVDMTPYKFMLRAVQRDERKRKCWGSLAFVLQEKDIHYIVEKIWHSHSAISECDDIKELRLSRWRVQEDWSPWNCILLTVPEMRAHLKLEEPWKVYDEELVQKVYNKHKLAKAIFEELLTVNQEFTETGEWHNVRAPAEAFVNGVTKI